MYPSLQKKFDIIAAGTQVLKHNLCLVEQRHTRGDKTCEGDALEKLINGIIQLEFDVTVLMADYISVAFRYPVGRISQVLDSLWTAFLILDGMYMGLRRLTNVRNGHRILAGELEQLHLSWAKLNKLTEQTQKRLVDDRHLLSGKEHSLH